MKRIAAFTLIGAVCAASPFVLAEDEKAGAKGAAKQSSDAAMAEHKMFVPADLKWGDGPPGLPPGARLAVLDGDPGKAGAFTIRLQAPDGYKVPAHTHPTTEHVTVISGTLHLGTGDKLDETAGQEMAAGSFAVMPAGMKHFAWMTGETVLQIHGTGPFQIKYVNPADDPRNAKK